MFLSYHALEFLSGVILADLHSSDSGFANKVGALAPAQRTSHKGVGGSCKGAEVNTLCKGAVGAELFGSEMLDQTCQSWPR